MADFNLLAALKTLGAGHPTTDNTAIATNLDGDSSSVFSTGSSSNVLNASTTQPTRAELLRATHQLVDGLLRMQSKASSSTPGYLSAVLPCLFKLLNNPSQDVRIAADEGINKLIKLLRVSMTHQVILELFVELKRNQSSRTVAASLSKFASLVNRIRISKRRFYMTELLPVLITVCERTEEPIFEALSDHFATIASHLFHYATESELREFLRRQRIHLSSDTALIRRSIAQLLVSTCQYSRYPFTLLRILLQDAVVELNSPDRPAISRCTGLLNTIRYLSIAWQQTLASSCNELRMETKQTLTSVSRTRISPESSSRLTSKSTRSSEGSCTDITGFPSNAATVADLPVDSSERDCQLWSLAFFTCLDYGASCSISVSTAALEALLQLLTARRPMMLYPRQWLSRSMHWVLRQTEPLWFEGPAVNVTSGTLDPDDPIELPRFGRIIRNESTNTLSSSAALITRLHDANPPSTQMFGLTGGTDDSLEHRSVSSLSLASSLDADPELSSAHQLVCQQLSVVKARLARTEPQAGHQRSQSDEDYSVDLNVVNSSYTSSDPSVIVLNLTPSESTGGEAQKEHSSTRLEHCPVRLLTLTELLSYLAPKDPVSLLASDWLISYLSVQFGLINNGSSDLPRPIVQPRTSSQLLAIACLIQLVQIHPIRFVDRLPLDLCCSSDVAPLKGDCPTGVDLTIDLLTTCTDPQVRGQLCLLIGQLIAAYLVQQRLLELHDVTDRSMRRLFSCLDSLLSSEASGTTYRLALAGLRSCANAVLSYAPTESSVPNGATNLLIDLLNCLARQFTPAARHSYRLVRLEFLHLVRELDWITLNYVESCKLSRPICAPLTYLTKPTRLFDLAWIETWRLLSDPESDVRDLASVTLTGSFMDVLPTVSDDLLSSFVERSLERRLQFWYPCEFSIFHLPIMSYGLLDCWSAQSVPPCLSGLPVELDVGPAGLLDLPPSAWLLYAESAKRIPCSSTERRRQLSVGVHVPGSSRLFRECVAGLLELPCASLLPDDRYMIHGIVRCLNRLLGQTHVLAFTDIWYEAVPSSQTPEDNATNDDSSCLERQHRPRIALLSWQCLTLLSATALTTCDLDLHIDLIQLCTGCLTRWALCSLTEGSIPTGIRSMSLDLRHSYTRFALSLLHHVARVLFVLWHVVEDLQPSLVTPSGAHADPFNPDPSLNLLHSIAQISQSDELSTTSSITKTNASSVSSRKLAPGEAQRRPMSARLGSPLKKAQSDSPSSETRRILGYFSHLPHYMALYQTLRTAFQTHKISLNSSCSQDRLIHFLQAYLHTLGRLMGNLRLAETAPYSDELLTYVAVLYHWYPGACLEASTQILRAFVGTNLISHWDSQLTELYSLALGAKPWPSSQICTKETALGSCSSSPNEKIMATDLSEDSSNPLDKLFDQHTQRAHILLSPSHSVSMIASWLGLEQLSRTPITAWIRFARQWRIPLPLTSKASGIKTELTQFFRRFEHIVIQTMEGYQSSNCIELQSGILNLLTHLICLKLNYDQLDTGQQFLQTVITHLENLPLELQRYQTASDGVQSQACSRKRPVSADHPGPPRYPQLINAMFRFLINLTYQQKPSVPASSTETTQSEGASTDVHRTVTFGQVMRMAETLAAEGLESNNLVLAALVPIVVDLYVIQRPLVSSIASEQSRMEQAKDPTFQQLEVQRETVLSFLLRRLSHMPASYDQLCLILEEVSLPSLESATAHNARLFKTVSQILNAVLTHLANGSAKIFKRNDLNALLRLIDHLILTLSSCANGSSRKPLCTLLAKVHETQLDLSDTPPSSSDPTNSQSPPARFICWAVCHVVCARFHLRLLRLLALASTSTADSPPNDEVLPSADSRLPFHVFFHLVRMIHQLLCSNSSQLATNLTALRPLDSDRFCLALLIQSALTHLLTLLELYKSAPLGNYQFSSVPLSDPAFLECHRLIVRLGPFEPLLLSMWSRLFSHVICTSSSLQQSSFLPSDWNPRGETMNMLRNYSCLNVEICIQALLTHHVQSALARGEKSLAVLTSLLQPELGTDSVEFGLRHFFFLWQTQSPPFRELFARICQCPEASRLFLSGFAQILPNLATIWQIRLFLQWLSKPLHPSAVGPHLDIMLDHFIAPRSRTATLSATAWPFKECPNCPRNPLPLGLQLLAIREACRLLQTNVLNNSPDSQCSVTIPLTTLMDYCARLPKNSRTLRSPLLELGDLLEQAIDRLTQTRNDGVYTVDCSSPVRDIQPVVDIASALQQLEEGTNTWLLDMAQSLLHHNPSVSSTRIATRLMQTLATYGPKLAPGMERRITSVLEQCCSSCSPYLLYYTLVLGLSTTTACPSSPTSKHCKSTIAVSLPPTPESDRSMVTVPVTGKLGPLFRIGQQLLFERIQRTITESNWFISQTTDPLLRPSIQSHLIGLNTALIYVLQLLPQFPSIDALPMETEMMAFRFLRVLIEFILCSMGYQIDLDDDPQTRTPHLSQPVSAFPCSVSLVQTTLDLMDHVIHFISVRLTKGVDTLGDRAKHVLPLFVTFLAAVDCQASLSEPLTIWHAHPSPPMSVQLTPLEDPLLINLVTPKYPSLFGTLYIEPVAATLVHRYTSVTIAASAANALSAKLENRATASLLLASDRIGPCQALNKCRLLRSSNNASGLQGSLTKCLLGCIRLLNITLTPEDKRSNPSQPQCTEFPSLIGLEPDRLAAIISRVGGIGWLDRRQFEHVWMSYLELLASSNKDEIEGLVSIDDGDDTGPQLTTGGPQELDTADLQYIEHNQCIELGLFGLTRLLLDAALRPHPGDPLHSQLLHQPRSATPHFSHTKLGRRLTSIISLIEYERGRVTQEHPVDTHLTRLPPGIAPVHTGESETGTMSIGSCDGLMELTVNTIEPNLEKLGDAPGLPSPSQFPVYWLVRRLIPSSNNPHTPEQDVSERPEDTDKRCLLSASYSPMLASRSWKSGSSGHLITEYEDLLFSCLQSTQLLYQSWSTSPSHPVGNPSEQPGLSTPLTITTDSLGSFRSESGLSAAQERHSLPSTERSKGLPLSVSGSVIRSALLLSDLFTAREQFEWLKSYFKDTLETLPSLTDFPAPIHAWLTLGLAKCTAVLELACSGPHSQLLQSVNLEPAVQQTRLALDCSVIPIQTAGLHSAMWLLHAALLIRTQPHQRQMQQHSPPTGSPLLNELYSQMCTYVERQLLMLFGPLPAVHPTAEDVNSNGSADAGNNTVGTTDSHKLGSFGSRWNNSISGHGTSGLKRLMAGMLGSGAGGGKSTSASQFSEPFDAAACPRISSTVSFSTVDGRIERHQLTVLAAAFFLTEHFSAPPVYPVLTEFGSGLTEMLSGLTAGLFRLASVMLADATQSPPMLQTAVLKSRTKQSYYAALGAGTTTNLCCSLAVHTAWCRGIGRLILTGRLGKGATESLQKMCITRLRGCRSPHISLPVMRLLVTCMYANAARVNAQIQQHRQRVSPSSTRTETNTTSTHEPLLNIDPMINSVSPVDGSTTESKPEVKPTNVPDQHLTSNSLDAEATVGMTQEFLSCLWERLRGGLAPIQMSPPISFAPSWVWTAWTSGMEASVVARLLPAASTDIIQAILGSLISSKCDGIHSRDEYMADPVLNKALGEFARLDHAHPQLAAKTLAQLFGLFLDTEGGRALVRQWVLLSLPTLLNRQPRRLAIWAATVCLLASATRPALRAALHLCYSAFSPVDECGFQFPSESSSTPLLSDLLCLASLHFIRFGLLRRSPSDGPKAKRRSEERVTFLNMFKQLAGKPSELNAPGHVLTSDSMISDHDVYTFRRVYWYLESELHTDLAEHLDVCDSPVL